MNYLHTHEAKIDCKDLKVILNDDKGQKVCFYEQREEKPCSTICYESEKVITSRL